jgi:septum site-determining protein MinC
MRMRAHSYVTFVFTPEQPLPDWLAELDAWLARSPGFFADRPVVLDLAATFLDHAAILSLIGKLHERNVQVLGLEGTEVTGPNLPPLLRGGRPTHTPTLTSSPSELPVPQAPAPGPRSLVLDAPVRSGQSIVFAEGDVTVLGSVGSGAEIVAGGSIHVYGVLRGRAMAGASGNPRARIFCNKIEAELLAIDGYYRTAEDIEDELRSRPAQAWLEGKTMMITPLN